MSSPPFHDHVNTHVDALLVKLVQDGFTFQFHHSKTNPSLIAAYYEWRQHGWVDVVVLHGPHEVTAARIHGSSDCSGTTVWSTSGTAEPVLQAVLDELPHPDHPDAPVHEESAPSGALPPLVRPSTIRLPTPARQDARAHRLAAAGTPNMAPDMAHARTALAGGT